MVLFSLATMASERSRPTFLASTSNAATNSHVAHVVGAEPHVHEAGHPAGRVGVLVVLHALDEGTGAVAHAHDGYPYRTHQDVLLSLVPCMVRSLVAAAVPADGLVRVRPGARLGLVARAGCSFRGDQLVQPADFPLDRLQAVPVQLEGVAVQALPGPGQGGADALHPLLEPAAPALQDPQPDVRPGLAEEGEPDTESVVLPGGGPRLGEQVLQPLLAFGGQPVDDLRPASGQRPRRRQARHPPRSGRCAAVPSGTGRATRRRMPGRRRAGR